MLRIHALVPLAFRLATLLLFVGRLAAGAPVVPVARGTIEDPGVAAATIVDYKWNVSEKEAPLLGFADEQLRRGLDRGLSYHLDQFRFPVFQALAYDEEHSRYLLPLLATENTPNHSIEFAETGVRNSYASTDGAGIRLIDNDSMKTIRTSDGTKYIFVRYPDGEFRCATIKEASGDSLNFLYAANGLILHGIVDASGRSVTFNYDTTGIRSVTQTWMAHSEGITKTWSVADPIKPIVTPVKYSHVNALKALPANAVVRQYTSEMAASDKLLARIFGGPNAVAGANGFEPAGLAAAYPFYRGDVIGDDGLERRGHLSWAMHLYGSADGTGDSALYVPAGFTLHSAQPTPTDAAVTFYYPKLGTLSDITLAVFHVADFQISYEGQRVRIGNLGGPGGSSLLYKHSHIEFYRGNTGLPSLAARAALRIDPTQVFQTQADDQ